MKYTKAIELIGEERMEQIQKHGFSIANDADYKNEELLHAAVYCLTPNVYVWPRNWDPKFEKKIENKSRLQKLVVAGAFIAAQIDRELYLENKRKALEVRHEQSFVGKWIVLKQQVTQIPPFRIIDYNDQGFIVELNEATGDRWISRQQIHLYELANANAIKERLAEIAQTRGFKPRCTFKTQAQKPTTFTAAFDLGFGYDYLDDMMTIHSNEGKCVCIYHKGQWGMAYSNVDLRQKVLSYL